MNFFKFYIFLFLASNGLAQLNVGDNAPSLLLNGHQGKMISMNMPYLNRFVLIHFWSSSVSSSRKYHPFYKNFIKRYKNALFRDIDGFELVCIAVQSDRNAWVSAMKSDSIEDAVNAVAVRGYQDEICRKFGINKLPSDFLIDNHGKIISVNPTLTYVEDLLDQHKNILPQRKEINAYVAYSSNINERFTYAKLYLFNQYYDTVGVTRTDDKGMFSLEDIKMNQDFIMKIENGTNIITTDPIALYTLSGKKIMDAKNTESGFEFYIPSSLSYKLTADYEKESMRGSVEEVNVTKKMEYAANNTKLSAEDIRSLQSLAEMLLKNKKLKVLIIAHSATNIDSKSAAAISIRQAQLIKNFFVSKGFPAASITTLGKGNSEPIVNCQLKNCDEKMHLENQRVQIIISKN
ncbi:MAG: OmpA family protein [Bacteroidia bacterium]|nr:OmpA family protein [Bacteroidia bacterium]